jgi:F-type H+-transporting ATPase subunit b
VEFCVSAILEQLGLDQTFFIQLVIFALLFFLLSRVYFKPFLGLLEARHKKTVDDREAAERLMMQAQQRFEDYKKRLSDERAAARKDFDSVIDQAKKEEAALLAHAREEARKITHEVADSVSRQRDQLRKQLEMDVESMARSISEKLLSRKV